MTSTKPHWTQTADGKERMKQIVADRKKSISVKSHHKMMRKDIRSTAKAEIVNLCDALWRKMTGEEKYALLVKDLK